jgi:glycosyltransferase involved in cell wall biosynthesis
MAAIVRFVTPGLGGALHWGAGPFTGPVITSAPLRVTAEAYPVAPATRITGQAVSINGVGRAFTSVSGENPATLEFDLGGDPAETAGALNTVTIAVTDDGDGGPTRVSALYFRSRADAAPQPACGGGKPAPTPTPTVTDRGRRRPRRRPVGTPTPGTIRTRRPRRTKQAGPEDDAVALTVGMATFRDFSGLYFTLQALRLYQDLEGVELLVVDNHGCDETRALVEEWVGGTYVRATDRVGTAAPRDLVFRHARGEAVLCLDSHVLLAPGVLARLKRYYREHPDSLDLLQGPLVFDDLETMASHFEPVRGTHLWGEWTLDPRADDPDGAPFDIGMQGLGLFSCRKEAWPGFHPGFRGFGGEEGYLHAKFRARGRRCLCLPWLRWVHRFPRPEGVPYPLRHTDQITNHLIAHRELGHDEAPVLGHFRAFVSDEEVEQALRDADAAQPRPAAAPATGVPPAAPAVQSSPELISCLCPTFGRGGAGWQHLLEEAVESFLRQTDSHSELLVLNDDPRQELAFEHPRVHVVNLPRRFGTLGEKYNELVRLARGDLLAPWEDDDISLPHRLALSRDRLGDADYFNPRRYWLIENDRLHRDHAMGVGHNLSLFRRRAWLAVGGYPAVTGTQDTGLDGRLVGDPRLCCRVNGQPLPVEDWYYIYRWGAEPRNS